MKKEDTSLRCAMEQYLPSGAVLDDLQRVSEAESMTEEEAQRILHMALRKIDDAKDLQESAAAPAYIPVAEEYQSARHKGTWIGSAQSKKNQSGGTQAESIHSRNARSGSVQSGSVQSESARSEEGRGRQVRRSGRRIALIAACVTILALSAVSFASTFLDGGLVDLLGGESQRSREILSDMGTILSERQSHNGYTVELTQLIHDRSSCYVLMEVSRDDGQPLEPGYHSFASCDVRLEDKVIASGWYIDPGEPADGTSPSVTLLLQYDASEAIAGKTVNLSFQDFGRETWDPKEMSGEFIPLAQADWEFAIEMRSQDNTQEFPMNQMISAGGKEAKAVCMYLSPISLAMDLRGDLNWNSEDELRIVLKDGTEMGCSGGSYGSRGGVFAKSHMSFQFSRVIDPQQIDKIYYNDQELLF